MGQVHVEVFYQFGEHFGRNQLDESAVELWGLNGPGVLRYVGTRVGVLSQVSTTAGSCVRVAGREDDCRARRHDRSGFEGFPSRLLRHGPELYQASIGV